MLNLHSPDTARFVIGWLPAVVCGLMWFVIVVFLRIRRNADLLYLALFTIFSVYLYKVLDYTLFQYQSLLLLKRFVPGLILNGIASEESVNLVPLVTLTPGNVRTSLLNVLLMVPFGFGLPFIKKVSALQILGIGALFSIFIELFQLTTALWAQMTFRVTDINDVIFNTAGVAIGYGVYCILVRTRFNLSHLQPG